MTITKNSLPATLSRNTDRTRKDCKALVDSVLETIKEALFSGGAVMIRGFGKLSVKIKRQGYERYQASRTE